MTKRQLIESLQNLNLDDDLPMTAAIAFDGRPYLGNIVGCRLIPRILAINFETGEHAYGGMAYDAIALLVKDPIPMINKQS